MSNALFAIYGKPRSSPWVPGLRYAHCARPERDLLALDRQYPAEACLYFLCANRGISYIGISGTRADGGLFRRLRQHWLNPRKLFDFAYAFGVPCPSLAQLEKTAIGHFCPESNISARNLLSKINDDLDGLIPFVEHHRLLDSSPRLRRFRIDLGDLKEPGYFLPEPKNDLSEAATS